MYDFKCKKIKFENESYFVITHNNKKVSVSSLAKIIGKLNHSILKCFSSNDGKITMMNGKNVITFTNEEQTNKAINDLISLLILDELTK